jgi:hypothetical protein
LEASTNSWTVQIAIWNDATGWSNCNIYSTWWCPNKCREIMGIFGAQWPSQIRPIIRQAISCNMIYIYMIWYMKYRSSLATQTQVLNMPRVASWWYVPVGYCHCHQHWCQTWLGWMLRVEGRGTKVGSSLRIASWKS